MFKSTENLGMKSVFTRVSVMLCLFIMSSVVSASFHKQIWPQWEVYNPLSKDVISHQEWQDFLTRCVITNEEYITLVDYPNLKDSDLELLQNYINRLSHINIQNYNRKEQLAFWINLYNALTVQIVADYYPIDSIQDVNISPGLFNVGPWGANLVTINGTQLSLDDIQNRIIRPIWNDPRTIYALHHATIGGANLSREAYQGKTVGKQLNKAAYEYINSLRGLQLIEGKLIVSKIYYWFLDDFGGNANGLIHHLSQYAKEPVRTHLKQINTINSYIYNWHLNSTVGT